MQETKNSYGGSRGGGRPRLHNEPTISITFDCPESLARFLDQSRIAGKTRSRSAWLVSLVRAEKCRIEQHIGETDAFIAERKLPL